MKSKTFSTFFEDFFSLTDFGNIFQFGPLNFREDLIRWALLMCVCVSVCLSVCLSIASDSTPGTLCISECGFYILLHVAVYHSPRGHWVISSWVSTSKRPNLSSNLVTSMSPDTQIRFKPYHWPSFHQQQRRKKPNHLWPLSHQVRYKATYQTHRNESDITHKVTHWIIVMHKATRQTNTTHKATHQTTSYTK